MTCYKQSVNRLNYYNKMLAPHDQVLMGETSFDFLDQLDNDAFVYATNSIILKRLILTAPYLSLALGCGVKEGFDTFEFIIETINNKLPAWSIPIGLSVKLSYGEGFIVGASLLLTCDVDKVHPDSPKDGIDTYVTSIELGGPVDLKTSTGVMMFYMKRIALLILELNTYMISPDGRLSRRRGHVKLDWRDEAGEKTLNVSELSSLIADTLVYNSTDEYIVVNMDKDGVTVGCFDSHVTTWRLVD